MSKLEASEGFNPLEEPAPMGLEDWEWVLGVARQTAHNYLSRLPPHVDPGDYLSAAYAGALYARDTYLPNRGAQFRSWLITCVSRALAQENRRQYQQRRLEMNEEIPQDQQEEELDLGEVEELVFQHAEECRVRRCIDRLTPRYREVIEMRFFRRLKRREIASRLGVSVGTVRKREDFALHRLREWLSSDTP